MPVELYFFNTIRACIESRGHDEFLKYLKDAFPLEERAIDSVHYFCAFVLLHIYFYGQVSDAVDMIFDVEKAIADEEYRRAAEHELAQRPA